MLGISRSCSILSTIQRHGHEMSQVNPSLIIHKVVSSLELNQGIVLQAQYPGSHKPS